MPKATRGEALNGVEARKYEEAPVKGAPAAPTEKKNGGPSQNSTSSPVSEASPSSSNGNATTPAAITTQFPQPSLDGNEFTNTALAGAKTPPAPSVPLDNGDFTKQALSGAQHAAPKPKPNAKLEREAFATEQSAKAESLRRQYADSQNFLEKDYIEAAKPFDQFGKMAASLYGDYLRNSGDNPEQSIVNKGIVPSSQETAKKVGQTTQGIRQYRVARAEQLTNEIKDIENRIEQQFLTSDYFGEAIGKNYGTHYNKSAAYQSLVRERQAKLDKISQLNDSAKAIVKKLVVNEFAGKKPIPGVTPEERIGKAIREASGDLDIAQDSKNLAFLSAKKESDDNEKQYTEKLRLKNFHEGAEAIADYHDDKLDAAYKTGKPKIDHVFDLADQLENDLLPASTAKSISDQLRILKSDPEVSNYMDAIHEYQQASDRVKNTLDNDFPQTKRQDLRKKLLNAYADLKTEDLEKINAAYKDKPYKLHLALQSGAQQLLQGLMGEDAGNADIPELAKRTGISEDKIKEIMQHRIGGDLFGVEGKGVRIPGLLQKLASGTYSTAESTFVTGARRFLNVNNADLKNKLVGNKVDDYQMQPELSKLFDDQHKLNLNAYSIMGTVGDTSAQAAVFGLPTLFTGGLAVGLTEAAAGLGRGLKVGMSAAEIAQKTGKSIAEVVALQKKAETIGKIVEGATTIGAGFTGSYESAYQEAAKLTSDEKLRRSYAAWSGFWNGASELILSPAEMLKSFHGKGGAASFRGFERAVQETGSTAIAGARMSAAFGKAMGKTIAEENIEELLVNYTDRYGEEQILGHRVNPGEFAQKNIETIVQTTIGTLGMGIGGGIGAAKDHSRIKSESLFEAGNEPETYKDHFEQLRKAGRITQDEYNNKAQVINTMSAIVANLPAKDKKGRDISHDQKVELAAQQFRMAKNEAIIANPATLTAEKQEAEKDNIEAAEIQSATLTGEPLYLVDGTPVKKKEFNEMLEGFHDAHLEVKNDPDMQQKLDDRFAEKAKEDEKITMPEPPKVKGNPEEISQPIELSPDITEDEHDDSFDDLTAASDEFASLPEDPELNAASGEFEALNEETTPQGNSEEVKVLGNPSERKGNALSFPINSDGKEVGSIVVRRPKDEGYTVSVVSMIEAEQGKGLGKKTYRELNALSLKETGKPLKAGLELNDKSTALWESLVKSGEAEKTNNGYAFKITEGNKSEKTSPIEPKQEESSPKPKPVAPAPKAPVEHDYHQKSVAIVNDEIMQAKTEAEKNAKNDKPVIGNLGQANENRRKQRYQEAKNKVALYSEAKKVLAKHATSEDILGDLTKEINEGVENPAAHHAAIEIIRKAQEYELAEKKKAIGNRIVSLQKDYNGLAKNRVKDKSAIMQNITQLAQEIGVTPSFVDGKLKVMNGDKALVKVTDKVEEDNTGRKTVEDRGADFEKFYDAMLPLLQQARSKQEDKLDVSLPAEMIRSAVNAIRTGKYNANAFDLLDDLQEMLDSGQVAFTKTIGSTVVREGVPVEHYLQAIEDINAAQEQLTDEELELFNEHGIDPSHFLDGVPEFMVNYIDELLQQQEKELEANARERQEQLQGEVAAAEEQLLLEQVVPPEVWEKAYDSAVSNDEVEQVKKDAPKEEPAPVQEIEVTSEGKFDGLSATEAAYLFLKIAIKSPYRPKYLQQWGIAGTKAEKKAIEALKFKGLLNSAGAITTIGQNLVRLMKNDLTSHKVTGNTEERDENYLSNLTGYDPKKEFNRLVEIFDKYGKKEVVDPRKHITLGSKKSYLIGKNRAGEELYEDDNGVRSKVAEGTRNIYVTESVNITPKGVYPSARDYQYQTLEEFNEANSIKPKPDANISIPDDKIAAAEAELKDALDDFVSTFTFNTGINPETVTKGIKVVSLMLKLGLYKFAEMVDKAIKMGVPLTEQLITGMKHAYGAYISDDNNPDDHIDRMDDSKTLRSITFDNVKDKIENAKNEQTTVSTAATESTEPSATEDDKQVPAGNETQDLPGADASSSEEVEAGVNIDEDIEAIENQLNFIQSGRSTLDPNNEEDAAYIATLQPELDRLKKEKENLNKETDATELPNDATQSGNGGLRSDRQDDLQSNQGEQAGTVQTDEGGKSTGADDSELGETISGGNAESDGQRNEPVTGEGNSLAGDSGTIRDVDTAHGDTTAGTHNTKVVNVGTNYVAPHVETRFADNYDKRRMFHTNVVALRLLVTLSEEGRHPTAEEQEVLASYSGWGGLANIIRRYPEIEAHWQKKDGTPDKAALAFREDVRELHGIVKRLDPDGKKEYMRSIVESTQNAHYTPAGIIRAIYAGIKKAGFKGGDVLEPSAGIGNFFANMPQDLMKGIKIDAIEKDPLTGQMLRRLYPNAKVQIKGFEEANVLENYYELAVGNVPFGDNPITSDASFSDNKDKRYRQSAGSIHNYFFVKTMKHVAPGGLMAFITSRYTMDGVAEGHKATRELIAEQGELVGAIRLPEHTFIATAGAEVTSDILFIRKYNVGEKPIKDQSFVHAVPTQVDEQEVNMNLYYQENPHNVLGVNTMTSTMYGTDKLVVEGDVNANLEEQATEAIKKLFPIAIFTNEQTDKNDRIKEQSQEYAKKEDYDKVGNMIITAGGQIAIVTGEQYIDKTLDEKAHAAGLNPDDIRSRSLNYVEEARMQAAGLSYDMYDIKQIVPAKTNEKNRKYAPGLVKLRQLTNKIFYQEVNNFEDEVLEATRKQLRDAYNDFVKKFGRIRDNAEIAKILSNDEDQYIVFGLERPGKDGWEDADMLHKRTINPNKVVGEAKSAWDAALISMEQLGKVDMGYMATLRNMTVEELAEEQYNPDGSGILFEEPDGSWTPKDDYLAGNVKKKLAAAQAALPENPRMQRNIDELEKVIPADIQPADIYAPMEARWVPLKHLQDFVNEITGSTNVRLSFSPSADKIVVSGKVYTVEAQRFKTIRWSGTDILESAINGIEPVVTYTENKKTYVDEADTITAKEKYRQMREQWDMWKYKDRTRKEQIKRLYNDTYNTTINRRYDGSHLSLPGLMGFVLLQHQKDAIWRFLQTMGGIADHMVGAGKTLIMIATAMEGRRLGLMKKPMIIGLKSQIPQMVKEFRSAYPLAKVLNPTPKDFKPVGRKKFMSQIASNDWDAVILTHDNFKMLKQPKDIQIEIEREMIEELEAEKLQTRDDKTRKEIDKKIAKRVEKLRNLQNSTKDEDMKDFGQLGIDFLMVDESQEFKNLEFTSNKKNVRGLGAQEGSQRSSNLLVAARYLQKLHGGDKGILFASGTPIANTMGELYLLFKYLRPQKLKEMGINTFDQWAGLFANVYSDLEYNLGSMKEINRFREFVNVPELLTMYREIADVRNASNLGDAIDRPKAEHHLIKIEPSPYQLRQIKMLKDFIDSKGKLYRDELGLTAGWDERRQKHTSFAINAQMYAKKLSVDPRLINPRAGRGSKIAAAAEKMAAIYNETNVHKGVQLVFSDLGTPKSSNPVVNVYQHIVEEGILGQTDLEEIFGEGFENKKDKGKLADYEEGLKEALGFNDEEDPKKRDAQYKAFLSVATDTNTFNTYNALRQELVMMGIPKEEIEFIHDHDGDVKRNKLYDRVNSGEVRILIGSTGKMGVGVNVQQRAVAAHHLDISWRPADLEQRNGRIERQKNFLAKQHYGNRVQLYYYATEKTLDASMYEVVRTKAKFIAQMKVDGTPERRMDDLEGDIDLGAMSAELSGDELFKEKNQLDKSVREKESLRTSFHQERDANEDKVHKMSEAQERIGKKIEVYKTVMMPFYEAIPKDEKTGKPIYSAEIPGHEKPFDKPGEAGKAVVEMLQEKLQSSPVDRVFNIGKVMGATVQGRRVGFASLTQERSIIERRVIAPDGFTVIEDWKQTNTEDFVAAGSQLATAVRDIPNELDKAEKELAKNKEVQAKIQSDLDTMTFPHEEKLAADKARLAVVNRLMVERAADERKALEARGEQSEEIDGDMSDAEDEFELINWVEMEEAGATTVVRDGMTVKQVLGAMSEEQDSNTAELAKVLSTIITGTAGDVKIRIDFSTNMKQAMLQGLQAPRASRSHYNPATNEIVLTAGDATIPFRIIHEAIHAATAAKLPPVNSKKAAEAVMNDPEASQEVKQIVNLFLIAAEKMGATIGDENGVYGFTSLDEFVAEAFSNADFQNSLAKIKYTVGKSVKYEKFDAEKDKTVWKTFISAIKHLIGLDEDTPHTLLEAIISATRDLVTYDDGILDDPKQHGKNGERRERPKYTDKGLLFSEATNEQKRQAALTAIAFYYAKNAKDKTSFYQFMQDKHNYGSTPEQKRTLRIAFEEATKMIGTINAKSKDQAAMNELLQNASASQSLKKSLSDYIAAVNAAAEDAAPVEETEQDQEPEEDQEPQPPTNANNSINGPDPLAGFNMKSTGDLKKLQSGETFQDVYLTEPEGSQDYTGRKLLDMVEDGDEMIKILQANYGNDILEYGNAIPQIIVGNQWKDVCKEIVLLGRVLHYIQVEKVANNNTTPELKRLEKQIMKLYQQTIRQASLGLNAGRLLRILRNNDLGQYYSEKILSEKQRQTAAEVEKSLDNEADIENIAGEEKVNPTETDVNEEAENIKKKKATETKQAKVKKKSSEYAQKAKDAIDKAGGDIKDLMERIKNIKPKC